MDIREVESRMGALIRERGKEERERSLFHTAKAAIESANAEIEGVKGNLSFARDELNKVYSGEKAKGFAMELESIYTELEGQARGLEEELKEIRTKINTKDRTIERIDGEINRLKMIKTQLQGGQIR